MSRTLSTAAYSAINAQQTGEVFHVLLTIENSGGMPIRMTDNSEDVVSRGDTFITYPFALELPSDEAGNISQARLSVDNVARALVDEVRTLAEPLVLTIEVVAASTPDTVEYSAADYTLKNVTYDALTISGTLTQENYLSEPYPKDIMSAATFPGQF